MIEMDIHWVFANHVYLTTLSHALLFHIPHERLKQQAAQ